MNLNQKQAEEAYSLISELLAILRTENEKNWSRGLEAVARELREPTEGCIQERFADARSIYNTMIAGGRGFSEYYICEEGEDKRIQLNMRLDELREKAWAIFNS